MERLGDEVKAEVAAIGEQLDEINFRMSGWTVRPVTATSGW